MQHTITLITGAIKKTYTCPHGANLREWLISKGIYLDSPCGGNGTCGKCRVVIEPKTEMTPAQARLIPQEQAEAGVRLACMTSVVGDCTVHIQNTATAAIETGGSSRSFALSPLITKKCVTLPAPGLSDQRSLESRLCDALGQALTLSPKQLYKLEQILKQTLTITALYYDNILLNIEEGDTSDSHYGIAVDIGTTTVVAYLYDLTSGACIDIVSTLNEQRSFGADVISRIDYAAQTPDGLDILSARISQQVTGMAELLLRRNRIRKDDLSSFAFAGNTTMIHLLCGVSPKGIATSPFIPVMTQARYIPAKDIGIDINPFCIAYILPCISAYVGADTVAAMAACEMEKGQKALLIDIGTNGEIVLSTKERLISCSTAAGPAFEGAHIRCGVGGIEGAISAVTYSEGKLSFTTIGGKEPIGICGSGIVDIVALLLELGVIDETGHMVDADEISDPELKKRITQIDGQNAFAITPDIVLTAKDVREVQLAKAAIAAGVRTLVNAAGVSIAELDAVYIAGGFGSYVDRDSAVKIGLLPREAKDRIAVCGNAAGMGAAAALCSREIAEDMASLQRRCEYIELSSSAEFQDWYMECMMF